MVGVVKSRQGGRELDSRKTDTGISDAPELRARSFSLNAAAGDLKTIWSLAIEVLSRSGRTGMELLELTAGRSWKRWREDLGSGGGKILELPVAFPLLLPVVATG
jgi:hypothetical protein